MGFHTIVVHVTGGTEHIKNATEQFVGELKKGATVTGAKITHGAEIAVEAAGTAAVANLGAFQG